jgi:hypothetical protein
MIIYFKDFLELLHENKYIEIFLPLEKHLRINKEYFYTPKIKIILSI